MNARHVPNWPHIRATLGPDSTGEVHVGSNVYPVAANSLVEARAAAMQVFTRAAQEHGRAVRAISVDPEGEWTLIVHPTGQVEQEIAGADNGAGSQPLASAPPSPHGHTDGQPGTQPTASADPAPNGGDADSRPDHQVPPSPSPAETMTLPPARPEHASGGDAPSWASDQLNGHGSSGHEPSGYETHPQEISAQEPTAPHPAAQPPAAQSPSAQSVSAQSVSAQSASAQSASAQSASAQSASAQSASAQSASAQYPAAQNPRASTSPASAGTPVAWPTADHHQEASAGAGGPGLSGPSAGVGVPDPGVPGLGVPSTGAPAPASYSSVPSPASSPVSSPAPAQSWTGAPEQSGQPGQRPPRRELRQSFLTPEQTEEPASHGVRGLANKLGLRVSASEAEKAERADVHAVSQHWPGPRTIAVVNGKGGAGKTPTTVLLAAVFARYGGAGVLAWDNNQTRGTLGWRTEQGPHEATLLDLLPQADRLLGTSAQAADLASFVHHQTRDRFDVLRSKPMALAHEQRVEPKDVDAIHAVAAKYYRLIIMDSGNDESDPMWLRMIDHADQIVVATTTRDDHAEAGALLLEALAERDERSAGLAAKAVAVVSQADPRASAEDVNRLADGYRELVREAVTIPHDPAVVDGVLRWGSLRQPTQRAWLAAAAAVARGL